MPVHRELRKKEGKKVNTEVNRTEPLYMSNAWFEWMVPRRGQTP